MHNSSKDKYTRHTKKAETDILRANCLFYSAAITELMYMLLGVGLGLFGVFFGICILGWFCLCYWISNIPLSVPLHIFTGLLGSWREFGLFLFMLCMNWQPVLAACVGTTCKAEVPGAAGPAPLHTPGAAHRVFLTRRHLWLLGLSSLSPCGVAEWSSCSFSSFSCISRNIKEKNYKEKNSKLFQMTRCL